jgi:DNA mismatch repair protein MutS
MSLDAQEVIVSDSQLQESGAQLSPLMKQYFDVKNQYPDALLFFRVGDFYELFDSDAQVAARELDIALTGRPDPGYQSGRVPMAGVPVRAVEVYLARLISKGYSVAICEQVGVVGAGRGPVERQVTRVLTPGTVLESSYLPVRENNYLVAILRGGESDGLWGLACVDASCGEFSVTQATEQQLLLEIGRLAPREILVAKRTARLAPGQVVPQEILDLPAELDGGQHRVTGRPAMFFQFEPAQRRVMQLFGVSTLEGFGCQAMPLAVGAAGAIIEYLEKTQGALMPKFSGISTYSVEGQLVLDVNTRKNLELIETARERSFEGSLLWALDQTRTGMGGRTLRQWLLKPLYCVSEIKERQDAVAELIADFDRRQGIAGALAKLSDLERLGVKLSSGTILPKELVSIQQSIETLPELARAMQGCRSQYLSVLSELSPALSELAATLAQTLREDAPRELTEGGIFKQGYSEELDEVRGLLGGGKQWIEDFQKGEQERTSIRSLKVAFNNNFGYYIEITHANKDLVPADYIRKQTLTNAERYITPDLKEYESKILNAEKNQADLEYKLFAELRKRLADFGPHVYWVAQRLAALDALLSLAAVAVERNYIRPVVDQSLTIEIRNGRHPVLERILPMGRYVANDTHLVGANQEDQLIILTGPNMAGKSSFLRQVALIVLLAQVGSFVPAEAATIGLVDRIFTRIGAVDDLTQGQSTFLVEMSETTQCCLSATERSLILLDEVGRGTSTYDGVAIAWSVSEYLAQHVKARTIFATHYHELNGLASFFPQISNYQVLVKETGDQIEFIRSVVPGGASRSFGIQVARMAGLPPAIIERAQHLMTLMERKSAASKILDGPKFRNISMDEVMQLSLFGEKEDASSEHPTARLDAAVDLTS